MTFSKQTTFLRWSSFLLLSYLKASLSPHHKLVPGGGYPPSKSSLPGSQTLCPLGHLFDGNLEVKFISTVWPLESLNHISPQNLFLISVSLRGCSLLVQTIPLVATYFWLARQNRPLIVCVLSCFWASLIAQLVQNPPAMQETWVLLPGWEDPLEKGKATHSSILAWRIPWTVQSMRSQRAGHDRVTFTFTFSTRGNFRIKKTFGIVWRYFWLSQSASIRQKPEMLLNTYNAQDSPHNKELLNPKCQ